jgi:hypothetical protein
MQRRRYSSDSPNADASEVEKTAPEPAKPEPAVPPPIAARGQFKVDPSAENALSVLLKQAQAAEEAQIEAQKAVEEYRRAQAAHMMEQQAKLPLEERLALLPDLTEAKRQFVRAHPEMLDNPANGALHFQALDLGHADDSPEYFAHIEKGLAANKVEKPTPQPQPKPQSREPRGPTVSAPVSRESISISTGRPVDTKIRLTPEQREAARFTMPGVPAAEAERVYAQNLLRLEQAKRAGLLQNGNGQ